MKYLIIIFFVITWQQQINETITPENVSEILLNYTDYDQLKINEIMKEKETLQTLLKTLHYSCIVLARMQLSRYGQRLMEVIESYPKKLDQNNIWKKIYSSHVQQCQNTITYEDSVKIFSNIKTNEFQFDDYKRVYENVTLDTFQGLEIVQLTQQDEKTWSYIQDFEKAMNKKESEEEELSKKIYRDFEPKVFSFSLRNSKIVQYTSFVLLILFVIGAVYYVKKIPKQEQKQNRKKVK